MIIVIAYHQKDQELVVANLALMKHFAAGGKIPHHLLLVADSNIEKEQRKELRALAGTIFRSVSSFPVHIGNTSTGWPKAANAMFLETARQIKACYKSHWLWLEPDAWPLKSDWIERIEEAYLAQPKRCMGAEVKGTKIGQPASHLSGVAIYPHDIFSDIEKACSGDKAFDYAAAEKLAPASTFNSLIHHHWGLKDLPPVFASERIAGMPPNTMTLADINPDAVIFHRVKDTSLFDILTGRSTAPSTAPEKEIPVQSSNSTEAIPTGLPPNADPTAFRSPFRGVKLAPPTITRV